MMVIFHKYKNMKDMKANLILIFQNWKKIIQN